MSEQICRRKSDGAFFEPSCRDGYTTTDAFCDMLINGPTFYFRRIVLAPRRWWQRRRRWQRTGDIWQPKSGEFDIVQEPKARQLAAAQPPWRYVPDDAQ